MRKITVFLLVVLACKVNAQQPLLTVGSKFPDMLIGNISNSPVKELFLNKKKDNKFYILNFWGTWCSPCIPEMDTLAKLQKKNAGSIQVIAISDDSEERKAKYIHNKPSGIWLATDTGYILYDMFQLAFVGQSAIVNPDKKIVALVKTDSINQQMIDKLLRGDSVRMSAGIREAAIQAGEDPFGVDSLMTHSFTIRGYKKGQQSMGKTYMTGPYSGRRTMWFNVSIGSLYRTAFQIKSFQKQERYDSSVNAQEVNSLTMEDKSLLYCVDLLVNPEQKDSLYIILQQRLNQYLPVKARLEKRPIEVFVLKQKPGMDLTIKSSVADQTAVMFSGRGFDGKKVSLADFADYYLTNELGLPVVDETGLTGVYDIKTNVEQRNRAGVLKSIEELGFIVEKTQREMPVIVYYK